MQTKPLLTIVLALATTTACGPGQPGGSVITEGPTTSPPPDPTCSFAGEEYEDGDEFETPDGCVEYRCVAGEVVVVEASLRTENGDLVLDSQAAVDAQMCLGEVVGDLTISNTAADLGILLHLARVGGDLEIANADVESLAGLEGILEVGGHITIADNSRLTALSFRPNLSAFGDVAIQNNDVLPSLIGGSFLGHCGNCGIGFDNDDETPMAEGGVADPVDPGGTFYGKILIADNDQLTDLSALTDLVVALDDVRLRNNVSLTELPYLRLSEVQGDLEISNHGALPSAPVESLLAGVNVWGATVVCGNQDDDACP